MRGDSLAIAFAGLTPPRHEREITTQDLPGFPQYRLGRLVDGSPAILFVHAQAPPETFGLRLRHVEYQPTVHAEIRSDGSTMPVTVAVLSCRSADQEMIRYFFRVVEGLLGELVVGSDFGHFDGAVRGTVELFDALSRAGRYQPQGLWAELSLIASSRMPQKLAEAWHQHGGDLFDFADAPFRAEVKSTVRQRRIHSVSLDQLNVAHGGETILVSTMLRPDEDGTSLSDVTDRALDALQGSPSLQRRVEKIVAEGLGSEWREATEVRFDLSAALASIRYYRAAQVPSVTRDLPPEVSNVRFTVEMSDVVPLERTELEAISPLMRALIPKPS